MTISIHDLFNARQKLSNSWGVYAWASETADKLKGALAAEEKLKDAIQINIKEKLDWKKTPHVLAEFVTPFGDGRFRLKWVKNIYTPNSFLFDARVVAEARMEDGQFLEVLELREYYRDENRSGGDWLDIAYEEINPVVGVWWAIIHCFTEKIKEQFENS